MEGDIHNYLEHGVNEIPAALELDLPSTWVKPTELKTLVDRAGNLFIYASTVLRVLGDEGEANPPRQLRILLDSRNIAHAGVFAALDELYLQLLRSSYPNKTQTIIDRFHHVVGSIILLRAPLTMGALERFTGVDQVDVQGALVQLQSVIITPKSRDDYPHIHHPSFPEFLTAPSRCSDKDFLVVEKVQEGWLAMRCLTVMISQLKKDPLGTRDLFSSVNSEVLKRKDTSSESIPPELQYACRYWTSHLERADLSDKKLAALLEKFATQCLLRWIESMSLLGYTDLQLSATISREAQTCAVCDSLQHIRRRVKFLSITTRFRLPCPALFMSSVCCGRPISWSCSTLMCFYSKALACIKWFLSFPRIALYARHMPTPTGRPQILHFPSQSDIPEFSASLSRRISK